MYSVEVYYCAKLQVIPIRGFCCTHPPTQTWCHYTSTPAPTYISNSSQYRCRRTT